MQTNQARAHIVVGPGSYVLSATPLNIDAQSTTSLRVYVHGGGAHIEGGSSDGFLTAYIPISMKDVELVNPDSGQTAAPLVVTSSATLVNVTLRGSRALSVTGQVTARNLKLYGVKFGLVNNGATTISRGIIEGGEVGISGFGGTLQLTNVLIAGASGLGIDVSGTNGSIDFSTLTDTGNSVTGTAGVRCISASLTFRSSIVWAQTTTNRPAVEGSCLYVATIVGPVGVPGAMNVNPLFANASGHDFHLSGGSPARDLVDQGPAYDFEGDARPKGVRYDIGADEGP